MPCYLVRNHEDHQIHGVFHASNMKILFWLVDEGCDPFRYEYKKVENGGVYFSSSEAPRPKAHLSEADADMLEDGDDNTAKLTEALQEVWETSKDGWKQFPERGYA